MGKVTHLVRDAGYEALFLLGGSLALSLHPTPRNAGRISRWIQETRARQGNLRHLKESGLVHSTPANTGDFLQLTKLGEQALAGGRHPAEAWDRTWDGNWRLLLFDLPRDAGRSRAKFWRWLRTNHFGRLQGSVWIAPDPVPAIEQVLSEAGLEPSMVMVFTGDPGEQRTPPQVAAQAWEFSSVNAAYREYLAFAERVLRQLRRKPPSPDRFRELLRQDRKTWGTAVKRDPLLPRAALPKGYQGPAAWKLRQKMHRALAKSINLADLP